MGRRSINTTKSGKYMNPTDQARKEARKKELKKNKRQRQMVRAAVLKNKDPSQILEEMEKIDEMEYNVMQPSPLNEKVLRDKRKKLKETFDRVMRLYHTEEPEHWAELKRKEVEYEKKRLKKQQYYESVKHAQSVQIDEIPLPSATPTAPTSTGLRLPPPPTALSLPPFAPGAPPSAIKKPAENLNRLPESTEAAMARDKSGVPVGPPPDLFDMRELDSDAEDDEVILKKYVPKAAKLAAKKSIAKPNSLQQRMLALSGQNIDEFMKEMENVHKKKEKERQAAKGSQQPKTDDHDEDNNSNASTDNEDSHSRTHSTDNEEDTDSDVSQDTKRARRDTNVDNAAKSASTIAVPNTTPAPPLAIPLQMGGIPPHVTVPGPPMPPVAGLPPSMLFRPPPLRPPGGMPAFGIRMPPGPPPGPRPRAPGMGGMPPRMGIRMPPGPPPGMPPRMAHHHKNMQQQLQQQQQKDSAKGVATITAKPQIRNLSADVTRFVPSALRVKREETRKPNRSKPFTHEQSNQTAEGSKAATKDDAYLQFMNEMQGLL